MLPKIYKYCEIFAKIAIPIPTDYLGDLHSKQLRETIGPKRELIVYHGTSTVKLAQILKHGYLDPDESFKSRSFDNSSKGIFVTTKLGGFISAEFYARKSANTHGGKPIVFELSVPIGWIEIDPDDTKILENDELNDAGKTQGIIKRKISIKRIKNIKIYSDNLLEQDENKWVPIGKLIKILEKQKELDEDLLEIVKNKKPGLSQSEFYEDREHKFAELLNVWYDNLFQPGDVGTNKLTTYDNALIFVHKNIYKNAKMALKEFCDIMGANYEEASDAGDNYVPRSNETLFAFLNRTNR